MPGVFHNKQSLDINSIMATQLLVPPHACDSHLHVFDPRFRGILPADDMGAISCTASAYARVQQALKVDRAVVVTPRNYDTDNAVTLDAIAQIGVDRARGVAVLRPDVDDSTLSDSTRKAFVASVSPSTRQSTRRPRST